MRTRNTKARGDSHLDALTPEQQAELNLWLTTGNPTYAKAVTHVRRAYGVSTNVSSVRSYYFNVALPWSYAQARGAAQEIAQLQEGSFEPAILKRLQQLAFELMTAPRTDVKTLRAFMKMLGDSRKLQLQQQTIALDARRVTVLESKMAEAKAKLEGLKSKGGLTPDTLRQIEEAAAIL